MKYSEAQAELKKILDTQQTVRTSKLKKLFMALNISVNKSQEFSEIKYLKNEIKKLCKENAELRSEVRR